MLSGVLNGWSLNFTPGTAKQGTATTGNKMDQNANGIGGESSADLYAIPTPANGSTTPFTPPFNPNTLPLIVPGPHLSNTAALDASGNPITPQTNGENLALNQAVTGVQVTFDRDMNPTTFTPAQVLSVLGPNGPISGPFTVKPVAGTLRKFNVLFPTPQVLNGTYRVVLASSIRSQSGDALDTNENAGVSVLFGTAPLGQSAPPTYTNPTAKPLTPGGTISSTVTIPISTVIQGQGLTVVLDITYANDPDLEVFLVAPDGTQIELIKNAGATGTHANFSGTILDDSATTSIQNGAPPFNGRFQPSQPLSAFNGKNASGTWTLKVKNDNASGPAGTLNSWSLTLVPPATTTYNAPSLPAPIPPKNIPVQPLNSSITIPDSFPVQAVSVRLDIKYANDPDLEANLIAPDGTTIQLFKNVGTTGTHANFTNTVFADNASTPITLGVCRSSARSSRSRRGVLQRADHRPRRRPDHVRRPQPHHRKEGCLDPPDHQRRGHQPHRHAQ